MPYWIRSCLFFILSLQCGYYQGCVENLKAWFPGSISVQDTDEPCPFPFAGIVYGDAMADFWSVYRSGHRAGVMVYFFTARCASYATVVPAI